MSDSRLEQFAADMHQEVLNRSGTNAAIQLREEAFTEYVLGLLSEHNEADGADVCYYEARSVGRLPAAKLNAYALSGDGATLDLFVTLYKGAGDTAEVGLPDMRRQFQLLRGFLRRVLDGVYTKMEEASDAFQVAQKVFEVRESLATVRLFVLTDGVARSLKNLDEELKDEKIAELDVRHVVWDLEKLSRLQVGKRETIELDFENDYGGAIPCLQMQDATGEYRTFLAFMPAPLLAKIYGEYGQRLLERNVRAFLQAKGKVNTGLQKTLKEQPNRFLAYNNGLCCTAAEVDIHGSKNEHALLRKVKDFQIVNGGQTTASVFHALKTNLPIDKVVVQVKLTVLSNPDAVVEIVPLISRYANSQNKVNAADFAANGKFHRQLEELSRTAWAPATGGLDRGTHWYYERARGSYADDRARQTTGTRRNEWIVQNPPEQKFTKTDLAKFEHAWQGQPHVVCLGAEKNFVRLSEQMEEDGEPLVDLNYFKMLVAKAILWRSAERLFDTLDLDGYRANSVAYAVAWMAEESGRRIDLMTIWEKQRLSAPLSEAVKTACNAAWDFLLKSDGNIGEVSKREDTWRTFRESRIETGKAWRTELADNPVGLAVTNDEEALRAEWDKTRKPFLSDARTLQALEAYTNREWVRQRRRDPVAHYAAMTWEQLRRQPGIGLKKIQRLVEMFGIASQT